MRILVVEDEEQIASFVSNGLRTERFAVDWAPDSKSALLLGKTNSYDCGVFDIKLPDGDGVDVCKELRAAGKTFPVVMLSVKNEVCTKVQALNGGADDYLTKPFSFEELLARVRALLRREKHIVGPRLTLGDLVLDTASHVVTRAGKPVVLSKKEYVLLEYFMRNLGVTLTRSMMLEHVWDVNADPFTNTVDVHVRFLREKIDKNQKRKLIQTIHGYGYRME